MRVPRAYGGTSPGKSVSGLRLSGQGNFLREGGGEAARPFGDKEMAENDTAVNDSGEESETKPAEPRSPRSIRFSDFEWADIEKEAKARGMTAAELVRHAAVSFAADKLTPNSEAFPPQIAAQIERIYRGVYLLSTIKRDQMVRDGQQEALDRIHKSARESQTTILNEASTPVP